MHTRPAFALAASALALAIAIVAADAQPAREAAQTGTFAGIVYADDPALDSRLRSTARPKPAIRNDAEPPARAPLPPSLLQKLDKAVTTRRQEPLQDLPEGFGAIHKRFLDAAVGLETARRIGPGFAAGHRQQSALHHTLATRTDWTLDRSRERVAAGGKPLCTLHAALSETRKLRPRIEAVARENAAELPHLGKWELGLGLEVTWGGYSTALYLEARVRDGLSNSAAFTAAYHREYATRLAGAVLAAIEHLIVVPHKKQGAAHITRLAARRKQALSIIKAWVDGLRAVGCTGPADMVVAAAHLELAMDGELDAAIAKGPDYWHRLGSWAYFNTTDAYLDKNHPANELRTTPSLAQYLGRAPEATGLTEGAALAMLQAQVSPLTVNSALGPLPAGEGGSAVVRRKPEASPPAQRRSNADNKLPWNSDDSEAVGAAGAPLRGKGTWLTATQIGHLPQPDFAGFWTSYHYDGDAVTQIKLAPDGRSFKGIFIEDGKPRGLWLDFTQQGSATAWAGRVLISLRNPKGKCPRWVAGSMLVSIGAETQTGLWRDKQTDPETCKVSDLPDEGALKFSRHVLASFAPIVPGKYVHLIGAPAVGSQAAQYAAAVEIACDLKGVPITDVKISALGAAKIVTLAKPCRHQIVVGKAGSYDIRVDYLDADRTIVHSDRLRAEIPPIPGLGG